MPFHEGMFSKRTTDTDSTGGLPCATAGELAGYRRAYDRMANATASTQGEAQGMSGGPLPAFEKWVEEAHGKQVCGG